MSKFLSEESGAASAEYALIIVMISLGLAVAVWGMASSVANSVGWAGAQIAQAAGVTARPSASVASVASVATPGETTAGADVAPAARSAARHSANGKAKGKDKGKEKAGAQ